MLVWKQLRTHAAGQPAKPAIVCGDAQLSYSEFAVRAEALAHAWLDRGLKPGDRIALHLRNGIDLATAYYACFAAGFVAVPVNNRLTPEEIGYVLEHSGSVDYVAQPDLRIAAAVPSLEFGSATGTLPEPDPDAPALLLYTSGTTARPKGVVHTQRTLAGNASYMIAWGLRPEDHTLLFTPMVHASNITKSSDGRWWKASA